MTYVSNIQTITFQLQLFKYIKYNARRGEMLKNRHQVKWEHHLPNPQTPISMPSHTLCRPGKDFSP